MRCVSTGQNCASNRSAQDRQTLHLRGPTPFFSPHPVCEGGRKRRAFRKCAKWFWTAYIAACWPMAQSASIISVFSSLALQDLVFPLISGRLLVELQDGRKRAVPSSSVMADIIVLRGTGSHVVALGRTRYCHPLRRPLLFVKKNCDRMDRNSPCWNVALSMAGTSICAIVCDTYPQMMSDATIPFTPLTGILAHQCRKSSELETLWCWMKTIRTFEILEMEQ